MKSIKCCFVTITDRVFFPGTLATINSILRFQPSAEIWVVNRESCSISHDQAARLQCNENLHLINSSSFAREGRYLEAWELKAHAACDLCKDYDVVVGIDSDCILCAPVDDCLERCMETGFFLGGQDGVGAEYGSDYQVYGIPTPSFNQRYMSTSLYFCAVNEVNQRILKQWSALCDVAVFNGRGPYPGHGDQGILNAILYAENQSSGVELLPNSLWSQHWVYWDSIIDFREGSFVNLTAEGSKQRAFHSNGSGEKFWEVAHRRRVVGENALQTWPYAWFLAMLFFGPCRNLSVDPSQYLVLESQHLISDLVHFLPQIFQIYPEARLLWDDLGEAMINRVLAKIPRKTNLDGGNLSELFQLVRNRPSIYRFLEIGGYYGGSVLALALRFANRDLDFYSVESFMGNMSGAMDGENLPSRTKAFKNVANFPTLRARLIPGPSRLVSCLFRDASLDFIFIDGCQETISVLADITGWLPKLSAGGTLAGDDYDWEPVRVAVHNMFGNSFSVTSSGQIWWICL